MSVNLYEEIEDMLYGKFLYSFDSSNTNLDNKKNVKKDYSRFKSEIVNLRHNKSALSHVSILFFFIVFELLFRLGK